MNYPSLGIASFPIIVLSVEICPDAAEYPDNRSAEKCGQ